MFGDSAFGFSIILVFMFMFFGVAILLCGWYYRRNFLKKSKVCSMAVKAEVVRVDYEDQIRMYNSAEETVTRYCLPTFRYDIGDELYEVESKLGGYADYKVGDIVKIYVNPHVPTEIFVPVTGGLMYYTLFMIGIVFIVMSIIFLLIVMYIVKL